MVEDRNIIQLGHAYRTTRRKYELMLVNEVDTAIQITIAEVDKAVALVGESWAEDGEMEIEIRVKQKMKKREATPWRSCACDPATGAVCRAHASTCTCGHPGAGCICRG